ncbi:MAG: hypothetical protein AAB320_10850 [Elusimicrobiota bacterium]
MKAQLVKDTDPYWPKWDSPWWHMTLLWELGRVKEIPEPTVKKMVADIQGHYRRFFLPSEDPAPETTDPYREIMCHCGWGTMYQVLQAYGVDVDKELPWVRPWFLKYQLPDGGLNCADGAYSGSAKSSIVSTLPPMEAMIGAKDLSPEEETFLDKGADYLLKHKLVCSAKGKVLNEDWLSPFFPRFYEYDELRGLTFMVKWSRRRGIILPAELEPNADRLRRLAARGFPAGRAIWLEEPTLAFEDGKWKTGCRASKFQLLHETLENSSIHLRIAWGALSL